MISKETIKKTALCVREENGEGYVVESVLFDRVIGTGDSVKEAWQCFFDMLDYMYAELEKGNVVGYTKAGRPVKEGTVALNCKVKEETHQAIAVLAKELGISQGELVDVMCAAYRNNQQTEIEAQLLANVMVSLDKLSKQLNKRAQAS